MSIGNIRESELYKGDVNSAANPQNDGAKYGWLLDIVVSFTVALSPTGETFLGIGIEVVLQLWLTWDDHPSCWLTQMVLVRLLNSIGKLIPRYLLILV